jgi:hypothetical protein
VAESARAMIGWFGSIGAVALPSSFKDSDLLALFGRRCRVKGQQPVPGVLDVVGRVVGAANVRDWFRVELPGAAIPETACPDTRWPLVLLDGVGDIPEGERLVMVCPRLLEAEAAVN